MTSTGGKYPLIYTNISTRYAEATQQVLAQRHHLPIQFRGEDNDQQGKLNGHEATEIFE